MAKVHELVEAELENIERTIAEFPDSDLLPNLSSLELAGVAVLVHNFYNGRKYSQANHYCLRQKTPQWFIVASRPDKHSDVKRYNFRIDR